MTEQLPAFWLTLEPYVYVSIKKHHAILYNTLSGEILEYDENDPLIIGVLKTMLSDSNLGVAGISRAQMEQESMSRFVAALRLHFMGDLLDASLSKGKPIQAMPLLKVHKDVTQLKKDPAHSPGENIMTYLNELILHVNSACEENCPSCMGKTAAGRQFITCRKERGAAKEPPVATIREMLQGMPAGSHFTLHITGGNIFLHSQFPELTELLNAQSRAITSHLHYLHLQNHESLLSRLRGAQNRVVLNITFPVNMPRLAEALAMLNRTEMDFSARFIVRSESEADLAEQAVQNLNIPNPFLQPWFDGTNHSFFEQFVFIGKDTIRSFKPSQIEILSRTAVNTHNFGKLTVTASGNIHADLNHAALGRLGQDSLSKAIYNEMTHGKSWFRIRERLSPCRQCVFSAICPSPSHYETVMARNNICRDILC